jgi:demethylmenaquinone methyltransferase/2-methoxy-6-polyprenyl-1,4-benzoquinol methylase
VLKPGGTFSMIEASEPKGWWLRPLYLFHLKCFAAHRTALASRRAGLAIIGAYTSKFGDVAQIAGMLRNHGLEVTFSEYFFHCATGVAGRKVAS